MASNIEKKDGAAGQEKTTQSSASVSATSRPPQEEISESDNEVDLVMAGITAHVPRPGAILPDRDRPSFTERTRKQELAEQLDEATKGGKVNPFLVRKEKDGEGKWGYQDKQSWIQGMKEAGQEGLKEMREEGEGSGGK